MNIKNLLSFAFSPAFHKQEEYFERITLDENAWGRILKLYLLLSIFSLAYGVIMGSYHGAVQALASGIKVCVLFSLALVICTPALLMIQFILGSKLRLTQMISIILSGFVLTTSIMIAFAPIVVFFQLTGGNYYFLILLHIAVWGLSGVFGMKTVIDALKFSCERKNVYPHTGVVVFRFWVVILAFVGIQLAWNLRPFLGKRSEPFQLFRKYEGNFYTAIIYSFRQLASGPDADQTSEEAAPVLPEKSILPFLLEEDTEN